MKKLKYLSVFAMLFGALAFACNDEMVRPLGGGEDEDDDPIIIDPPPPTTPPDTVLLNLPGN
ncbi:MAG: hypothetical protein MJA30_15700 [Cytophagales bacterium]|nr:hypothetical protein [Cytophagales bacterium]